MDLHAKIRSFISETFFVDDFGESDSFLRSSIIDSGGMLELVAFLERTYGIQIAEDELVPENLDTLADIARFVSRKLAQAA